MSDSTFETLFPGFKTRQFAKTLQAIKLHVNGFLFEWLREIT